MYLLMNDKEKIILDTIKEIANYNVNNYNVYSLVPVDATDLIGDGEIRDEISRILSGKEMTKEKLLQKVRVMLDIPPNRISKVITKMKKEGTIFILDDLDYMGNKVLGME